MRRTRAKSSCGGTRSSEGTGIASRIALLTALAMFAFAANSLLCRIALRETAIDAASFTTIRIASGAVVLWLIVRLRGGAVGGHGVQPHDRHIIR